MRPVAVAVIGVLAVANLPVLTGHRLVDPAIDRDQDPPAAWTDATAALDAGDTGGTACCSCPGQEFGAFRWGYTVDPPLPGMTDKPLVTRDLLPLGSAAAMDLLYALDDRFQSGTVEPDGDRPDRPAARRRHGVVDRRRRLRPLPHAAPGDRPRPLRRRGRRRARRSPTASRSSTFRTSRWSTSSRCPTRGSAAGRRPSSSSPVDDAVPVVRAKDDVVARRRQRRRARRRRCGRPARRLTSWSATPARSTGRAARAADGAAKSSSPTPIATGPTTGAARRTSSASRRTTIPRRPTCCARIPPTSACRCSAASGAAPTVAVQDGPVRARATAYGEPFAYRPEDRPSMAVDGDPSTAWRRRRSRRSDRRADPPRRRRADRPPHAAAARRGRRPCATSARCRVARRRPPAAAWSTLDERVARARRATRRHRADQRAEHRDDHDRVGRRARPRRSARRWPPSGSPRSIPASVRRSRSSARRPTPSTPSPPPARHAGVVRVHPAAHAARATAGAPIPSRRWCARSSSAERPLVRPDGHRAPRPAGRRRRARRAARRSRVPWRRPA